MAQNSSTESKVWISFRRSPQVSLGLILQRVSKCEIEGGRRKNRDKLFHQAVWYTTKSIY